MILKTNYNSPEDQRILRMIFNRAIMSTDFVFELQEADDPHLEKYVEWVKMIRSKIFQYLGEEDPNQRYFLDPEVDNIGQI